jgi:hypothetical protein
MYQGALIRRDLGRKSAARSYLCALIRRGLPPWESHESRYLCTLLSRCILRKSAARSFLYGLFYRARVGTLGTGGGIAGYCQRT